MLLNTLVWICCRVGWLLLGVIRSLLIGMMIAAGTVPAFVLSAQLARYLRSDDWYPVSNSEFLNILRIDVGPMEGHALDVLIFPLMDASATLSLSIVAIILFVIVRSTRKLEQNLLRYDPYGARRKAMIRAIEGDPTRSRQ